VSSLKFAEGLASGFSGHETRRTWSSWRSASALGFALGLLAVGVNALLAAATNRLVATPHGGTFFMAGIFLLLCGWVLLGFVQRPERHRGADILGGLTVAMVTVIFVAGYLMVLTEAVPSFSLGLYESANAITTTALSGVNVEALSAGSQVFRAGLQWTGGLATLLLGVAIVPTLGAGRDLADRVGQSGMLPLAPSGGQAARNILFIYLPLSLALWLAFALTGMGVFDGLLLALSVVSTGGLAVPGDPFRSGVVQWIAIVGMSLSGVSLVVLWRLAQRKTQGLWRSMELRFYLLGTLGLALLLIYSAGDFGLESVRHAAFIASSAISTTGFAVQPFGPWVPLVPVAILCATAIGGMAGSISGGFHLQPLVALVRLSRRELLRQLHPRMVLPLRLGGVPVDERTIERMVVLQFLFIATVITTSLAVALTGFSVVDALGMAVHATATGGPVRSSDGIPQDPASWGVLSRLVLIPAMVAGRMAIFPVLVTATSVGAVTQQKLHLAGRRVRKNLRRS